MNHSRPDYTAQAATYREIMRNTEKARAEAMAWAFRALQAAEYFDSEYRHAAKNLHCLVLQHGKGVAV